MGMTDKPPKNDKSFDFAKPKRVKNSSTKISGVEKPAPCLDGLHAAKIVKLKLSQIKRDARTQFRKRMNKEAIEDYRVVAKKHGRFDKDPVAFKDDELNYWLADGWHRVEALELEGKSLIFVEVREGTLLDAMKFAAGANAENALRRTNEDKRFGIKKVFTSLEFGTLGNNAIAAICKVSSPLVAEVRVELEKAGVISHTSHVIGLDKKRHPAKKKSSKPKLPPVDDDQAPPTEKGDSSPARSVLVPSSPSYPGSKSMPPAKPTREGVSSKTLKPAPTDDSEKEQVAVTIADPADIFKKQRLTDVHGGELEFWLSKDGLVGFMLARGSIYFADKAHQQQLIDKLHKFVDAHSK